MLFQPTPQALPQTRIDSYGSDGLASREPQYQCGCGSFRVCLLDQNCVGGTASAGSVWVRKILCQECGDRTTQTWTTSAVVPGVNAQRVAMPRPPADITPLPVVRPARATAKALAAITSEILHSLSTVLSVAA